VSENRSGTRIFVSRRLIANNFTIGSGQGECLCFIDVQYRLHFIQVGRFEYSDGLLARSRIPGLALIALAAFPANAL
jgi:hypothetical protein